MIEVKDNTRCSGCAACANACPRDCIDLEPDEQGSEYPVVDADHCIECRACELACPVLHPKEERSRAQRAFLIQHQDTEILLQSTSGGAFTAMAESVIDAGGMVYGAGYRGLVPTVCHFGVESKEELAAFRNSKYVQSSIGLSLREIEGHLKSGREVLFSGTPCQAEGLIAFLGKAYPNLGVADVVCHAAPRRPVFTAYLEWLAARFGTDASCVRFRDKARFGYRYSSICAYRQDSDQPFYSAGVESDPYLRAFFGNLADREICYACPFKKRYRVSDVTLWDCFDVGRFSRELDDNRGATRVLVQSAKGQAMVDAARLRAKVVEIDADRAVEGVREMFFSVPKPAEWEAFATDVRELDGHTLFEKWFPDTYATKFERWARLVSTRLGVYDHAKKIAKKVLGRLSQVER